MKPRRRDWFHPGDTPLDTARELCRRYRDYLYKADPTMCAVLDDIARELGQDWAIPQLAVYDPDTLLSPADLAAHCGVKVGTVHNWAHRGHIRRYRTTDGKVRHRLGDAVDYQREQRLARAAHQV